jgi:hypothetical protein
MPFDGNGNWVSNFSAEADRDAGYKILASRFDNIFIADIAAGFGNCVTRDGQGIMQTNFNANNYRVINVADPVNDQDAVNLRTIRDGDLTITGNVDFTGTVTVPTPADATDSTTKVATTEWVGNYISASDTKNTLIGYVMPDYSAGISISSGNTIPSNGIVIAGKFTIDDYWNVSINRPLTDNVFVLSGGGSHNQSTSGIILVSEGDTIYATNGVILTFYPCKGEQDEEILESS